MSNSSPQPIDPEVIFSQASQYHHCLELLRRHGHPKTVILPSIVMAAFTLELYLKTLICLETGDPTRGHDLYKLFQRLANATQDDLRSRWSKHVTLERQKLEGLERQLGRTIPRDLDWALEAGSRTFEELRYLYEREPNSEFIIGSFTYLLRQLILERQPNWRRA